LFTTLTTDQIKQMLNDTGPLMVGIYANTGFMSYSTGIYSGCPSNSAQLINHAVELIGYDASNNWIIKNQWDTTWGMGGFMTVSNTFDCGLSSVVISVSFQSINANVSKVFDPTVY
jgi:C1A family cysteine protease